MAQASEVEAVRFCSAVAGRFLAGRSLADPGMRDDLHQEGVIAGWREWRKGMEARPYLAAAVRNRIRQCLMYGTRLGSERPKWHRSVDAVPRVLEGDEALTWDVYPSEVALDLPDMPDRDLRILASVLSGLSASEAGVRVGLSGGYGCAEWRRIRKLLREHIERSAA